MKRGFVLMETIIVISVLCITLIMLYTGFSNVTRNLRNTKNYDNTEYLYKTYIISSYLKDIVDEAEINKIDDSDYKYYIYCSNKTTKCNSVLDNNIKSLSNAMGIQGIYITEWDTTKIDSRTLAIFEPTTQKYIKNIDPEKKENTYRIICMFMDENTKDDRDIQYASIEFRTHVYSVNSY